MIESLVIIGLFVLTLFTFYLVGVPVAYAMGLSVLSLMILPIGGSINIGVPAQRMFTGVDSFILLAVPAFLFAGKLMNSMGMTDDIFDFAEELVGSIKGGLGHVNIVVSMIFSGMSGSAVADAAGLGTIEYKAMNDRGYDSKLAAGITGSSAIIGPILPPSIIMIIYASAAQESVGALFIGGIIPGLLMGLALMTMVYVIALRNGMTASKTIRPKKLLKATIKAVPALLAPVIIIGGILIGWFTPTEAAVVVVLYGLFLGLFYYRSLSLEQLYNDIYSTVVDTAAILIILSLANLYAHWITLNGIPLVIGDVLTSISGGATTILLVIILVYLLLGTFIDATAVILITVPMLAPVFPQLGIDPIHFGVVGVLALMIGLLTPPLGLILFVLEKVTDVGFSDIVRGVAPFYVPLLLVLGILVIFPELVLYLPNLFELG